ncbi:MAG: hypothetical protein V4671_05185 [Armatimonadota bacterium]
MKLWLYLLLGLALFIALSWVLAIAAGLLQYLIWAIVLGAVVFGAVGVLFRSRGLSQPTRQHSGLREVKKAERELKRMEKQQARERAR